MNKSMKPELSKPKVCNNYRKSRGFGCWWYVCLVIVCALTPVEAAFSCTIFVLTDAKRTLFFNNEDYSNPATRIWFQPATKDYYGCAYLGFNDGWAQGGVNQYGLAFDWVAGANEAYTPASNLKSLQGNAAERMLESCRTVNDAITFYQRYAEPGFASASMLIADKTGASVIISAQDEQLHFNQSHQSRGFGYGNESLKKMLTPTLSPSIQNGLPILKACRQEGIYATKYSSVYDLTKGDISLVSLTDKGERVTLNLPTELKKGGHYYDIPAIGQQRLLPLMPLVAGMNRYLWEGYEPFPADEPVTTNLVQEVIKKTQAGTLRPDDFTPEFWKVLAPIQKDIQSDLRRLGTLLSVRLLERKQSSRLYLMDYQNATVLQRFELDSLNRIASIKSEAAEMKVSVAREK
ncbi:carcinine hydrolase/isopenicillin-N N-acyltransferase family protein [Spirosoma endbachense]|nr:carcinine hydrolase/isopenicillin-N N-acyltransferase family protein [Spirosoma endbachense]